MFQTVKWNSNTMFFAPISRKEIQGAIKDLKDNNFNHSDIPVKLLKFIADDLSIYLEHLFNICIEKGLFPSDLKIAHILPIHKTGDKKLVSNFRPISLLNPIAKIFEKIISLRLINFFQHFDLLSKIQFGFTKGKGVENAVLTFLHDIYNANINNQQSISVFIDFKKAFDTINHEILLKKLHQYGIRGKMNDFFKSYLTNRINYVRIGEYISESKLSCTGVAQGSCLGPLLFIIYINDIVNVEIQSKMLLYADDIVLYYSHANSDHLTSTINTDLFNIYKYTTVHKLIINWTKTFYMVFNKPKNGQVSNKIDDIILDEVIEYKYLGLTIDNNLKFKTHTKNVVAKLNNCNRVIASLREQLPRYILRKIYLSIGYPHINLHILAWGGTANTYTNPINIAVNKIVRNIFFTSMAFYEDTSNTYKILNISTLEQNYNLRLSEFIFNERNGRKIILQDFLHLYTRVDHYPNRRLLDYQIPYTRTRSLESFFVYKAISLWNMLDSETRKSETITVFVKRVKAELDFP